MNNIMLNDDWTTLLKEELESIEYKKLMVFINNEYKNKTIYPDYRDIFRAFNLSTPENVQVVIVGQDPYHGAKQANGLAFSVLKSVKIPPSLRNIYKELRDDIGCKEPINGDLTQWAKQGVLLINSVLTVEEATPNSHKNIGWEAFSDSVIKNYQISMTILYLFFGVLHPKQRLSL